MPTTPQLRELVDTNNTTSQWTSMNDVNGRKFINKSDSNKYIFLPAGGYWKDTSHNNAGSTGYYWSTNWYSSSNAINMIIFSSRGDMQGAERRAGYSIRGIK